MGAAAENKATRQQPKGTQLKNNTKKKDLDILIVLSENDTRIFGGLMAPEFLIALRSMSINFEIIWFKDFLNAINDNKKHEIPSATLCIVKGHGDKDGVIGGRNEWCNMGDFYSEVGRKFSNLYISSCHSGAIRTHMIKQNVHGAIYVCHSKKYEMSMQSSTERVKDLIFLLSYLKNVNHNLLTSDLVEKAFLKVAETDPHSVAIKLRHEDSTKKKKQKRYIRPEKLTKTEISKAVSKFKDKIQYLDFNICYLFSLYKNKDSYGLARILLQNKINQIKSEEFDNFLKELVREKLSFNGIFKYLRDVRGLKNLSYNIVIKFARELRNALDCNRMSQDVDLEQYAVELNALDNVEDDEKMVNLPLSTQGPDIKYKVKIMLKTLTTMISEFKNEEGEYTNKNWSKLIFYACSIPGDEGIKLLGNSSFDFNKIDECGDTSLHSAVRSGNFEAVKELTSERYRVDLTVNNRLKKDALALSVERNLYKITRHIRSILKNIDDEKTIYTVRP